MAENKFFNFLKRTMFPSFGCPFCDCETLNGELCKNCKKLLIQPQFCEICGEHVSEMDKICNECKETKRSFDQSRSVAEYRDAVSMAVINLKYNGRRYIADGFAKLLSGLFESTGWKVDYVCSVPSSKNRIKERGFNHAQDIAKKFCENCGLEYVELLDKIKETDHQTNMTMEERLTNLQGAFKLRDKDIKGKNILIVDDVFTTGSTLDACSKAIRKGKPNKIYCLTIGKTVFNKI
ncbi:MAG: ComF family protein [Clostridia bacterium]|nr:ComF family protein [Clostridia bacterium]